MFLRHRNESELKQITSDEFYENLMKYVQPERLTPEDSYYYSEFGCSIPTLFNTSHGIKRMEPGKRYDQDLNEIGICDSPNTTDK
jgi:hypothetical protein